MFEETPENAWSIRYGTPAPPIPLGFVHKLLNHRSVRRFKTDPIPESTIEWLMAAAQSASTSSTLQLWSAVSVQEPDRREAIAKLCADQDQVRNASWFFAFFADHYRLRQAAKGVGEDAAGLDYEEFYGMALIDAALAAERMVCAAETMDIGVCYIGALRNHPEQMAELLGAPVGTYGLFGLCLGWPEEPMTAEIKPRLPQSAVWHRERYKLDLTPEIALYDERMRAFYESQQMKGEVTWSMRSGRRVDGSERSLTGRGVLRAWKEKMGFAKR
jgi:nitroreductase